MNRKAAYSKAAFLFCVEFVKSVIASRVLEESEQESERKCDSDKAIGNL